MSLLSTASFPNTIRIWLSNTDTVYYNWQEISPGNASGSGAFPAGNLTRTITGLPSNGIIRIELSSIHLKQFVAEIATRERLVDVESWGTAEWASMQGAFAGCTNLSISATDIPKLDNVTNMQYMFSNCSNLNGPANIGLWNTSNVTRMLAMFQGASNFNQPIGNWDVSSVQFCHFMFNNATAFNQELNNWNLSNATTLRSMFDGASSFSKPLVNWTLNPNANLNDIFSNSGLGCDNYTQTLVGWQQNNPNVLNRTLGAININHKYEALAAKDILINSRGWTINDSGIGSCEQFVTLWNMSQFSMNPDEILFNANITGLGAQ